MNYSLAVLHLFLALSPEIIKQSGAAPERLGFLNSVTLAEGSSEQTLSRPAECLLFHIDKSPKQQSHLLLLPGYLTVLDAVDGCLAGWLADIINCRLGLKT